MLTISLKNIFKSFGAKEILKDISFNVQEGDKIGLIGQNGGGKSTLLKIISNQLQPDSGEIFIHKSKTLGYLNQNCIFDEDKSTYENALQVFENLINMENKINKLENLLKTNQNNSLIHEYTELMNKFKENNGYTYKQETLKILKYLNFENNKINQQTKYLSGGEKKRLDLAKLLLKKPDILLLDEPTNHLDLESIEWLENYLKNLKCTLILISHDRYFLDKIVTHIFELENSKILTFNLNYTNFLKSKEIYQKELLDKYNLQQKFLIKEKKIIENYKSRNREKSSKAAESREKRLSKIKLIEKPKNINKINNIKFNIIQNTGNDILKIKNLSKYFNDKKIFENINLSITKNEKIAIIGKNGIGKSTFFKILSQKESQTSGEIIQGNGIKIGYYEQEQKYSNEENTVFEEIRNSFPNITNETIRRILSNFLFLKEDINKKICMLSGGEKCKLSLIKLMLSNPNVILMDEPTNHLDIYTREALENAINNFEGTCLIISHDRYFLNKIVDKIYEFKSNTLVEYLGNYDYYIFKKENSKKIDLSSVLSEILVEHERTNKKKLDIKPKKPKKTKTTTKNIKKIESDIFSIENKICELENRLSLKEVYSNYKNFNEINLQIEDLKIQLSKLYEKWDSLI